MKIRIPNLYVEQTKSAFAEGNARWTNHDLDPTPHHLRKWGVWSFIAYWISDAFNVGAWQFSGSVIAVGLSWKESLAISALGYFIISFVIALNGQRASYTMLPFPLSQGRADFSRYSRVSVKWQAMYIPLLPAIFTFVSFIGTAVSSAGQAKYGGDIPWDPNTLISLWENRACRFFAGFSLVLASIGLNISANSLSAANDLTALAPRFINIRRGQLLCGFISWLIMPWKILKSAKVFLNFMSAYAIFLGPIAGIMLADFWVVKCQKYDCMALYHPRGIYRYSNGVNWRAIVAFVAGVTPSLPGLINSVNDEINVGTGVYPYKVGWFLGIAGTNTLYIALSRLFPAPETLIAEEVLPDQVYIQRSENSNTAVNFSREQLKSEVSSNIVHEAKNDAT
ncbi:hypothetical protein LOZ53_003700 [Ophidiomyces ophidiicola]|nr:hypothetical protein LOZ53_003700 [Ophidiomyces ophidiicola]